ncbi:MAG TPA: YdeI/OmpD-associated family protein [Lapillicoccus sp.]|nr:YdeI/OmpD-associated family protein [Lapillicoccus sp.]
MGSRPGGTTEKPALFFDGPEDFRAWLEAHHETETELWMGLNKKHVPNQGLTWEQAVPEALCFGWIDSRAERIDEDTRRQRWTPRKKTSTWSRVNLDLVDRLTREGRMRPMGIAAWEARREDRQAIYSFEQGDLELPEAYAAELAANPAASAFWAETTASYRKICINWVRSAKQQVTNDKRMAQLIEDSAAGRLIPSQRYGEIPKWVERAAAAARAATG